MQTSDQDLGAKLLASVPTWRTRTYRVAFWFVFGVAIFGFGAVQVGNYVPSNLGQVCILVFSLCGVIAGVVFGLGNTPGRNPFLRVLASAVLMLGFFYCASVGLEYLSAVTFGGSGDRAVTIGGWRTGHKNMCGGPNFIEVHLVPAPLCLDESWRPKLPIGTKVILHGRQTAFGMQVSSEEIAPKS